jgi:hypothetical protein
MARPLGNRASTALASMCSHCRRQRIQSRTQQGKFFIAPHRRPFTTTKKSYAELQIRAAPEIDIERTEVAPARILPRSPSYFTASPVFNDHVLLLQFLVKKHQSLPTAPPSQIPRAAWLKLAQYRSSIGEQVAASKYSRVLLLLTRLNKIHPRICPKEVRDILKYFRRPGAEAIKKAKPGTIDEHGRSTGIGRRSIWLKVQERSWSMVGVSFKHFHVLMIERVLCGLSRSRGGWTSTMYLPWQQEGELQVKQNRSLWHWPRHCLSMNRP